MSIAFSFGGRRAFLKTSFPLGGFAPFSENGACRSGPEVGRSAASLAQALLTSFVYLCLSSYLIVYLCCLFKPSSGTVPFVALANSDPTLVGGGTTCLTLLV